MSDSPILSLGEALVEFLAAPDAATTDGARRWRQYAGGGPATYAAAAVRCGRQAALITRVGDDCFSEFMVDALTHEGVDVSGVRRVAGRQIGLCFHAVTDGRTKLLFHRRDSAATTLEPGDIDAGRLATAAALHVPGTVMQISPSARETARHAITTARDLGVVVSFDPNIRTIPGGTEAAAAFEEAVACADLVMPTLAEATVITGKQNPEDAARELRARGPKLVAVTLAAQGCVMLAEGDAHPVHCPGYEVDVVEVTGAGDCHAAAMTVGYLAGWDPPRIGAFANAAGALAVTAVGHFGDALPTLARIQALLDHGRRRSP
ncbi:MAG: sugar kinase [bacterium]|nr:sugar kinase [bacterium]